MQSQESTPLKLKRKNSEIKLPPYNTQAYYDTINQLDFLNSQEDLEFVIKNFQSQDFQQKNFPILVKAFMASNIPFFTLNRKKQLPLKITESIVYNMKYEYIPKRQVIYNEGEQSEFVYFILSGKTEFLLRNDGQQLSLPKYSPEELAQYNQLEDKFFMQKAFPNFDPVKTFKAGDYFGETEIRQDSFRMVQAITLEDCHFLKINTSVYQEFMLIHQSIKDDIKYMQLISLFKYLKEEDLELIYKIFEIENFDHNKIIYQENDFISTLYFIRLGQIEQINLPKIPKDHLSNSDRNSSQKPQKQIKIKKNLQSQNQINNNNQKKNENKNENENENKNQQTQKKQSKQRQEQIEAIKFLKETTSQSNNEQIQQIKEFQNFAEKINNNNFLNNSQNSLMQQKTKNLSCEEQQRQFIQQIIRQKYNQQKIDQLYHELTDIQDNINNKYSSKIKSQVKKNNSPEKLKQNNLEKNLPQEKQRIRKSISVQKQIKN
ncbi:Cyclic nucleotide-binding protein [Pseudocohnilembus persalinus]|uniref:Cyclic nucleotide-binding protein n=1 Tax=Pseudocohnilembus persalinus TaxID=266149 RepID=A0A0V0QHA9_PSEPJ|nr:Cyclic nucleotide-binding protein [Pseudocohnilembus persalinus]|eukprot:KRX01633.1 Cyclic nucleotide-binding protein [Pseudocohnilembus persalinus]